MREGTPSPRCLDRSPCNLNIGATYPAPWNPMPQSLEFKQKSRESQSFLMRQRQYWDIICPYTILLLYVSTLLPKATHSKTINLYVIHDTQRWKMLSVVSAFKGTWLSTILDQLPKPSFLYIGNRLINTITLYRHGTTILSPWEIYHSYSSSHNDHYPLVVA